jgi:hypothetical protein
MRLIACIGTFAAVLLCASSLWAQDAERSRICTVEVREAVRTALQYGVADVSVAPELIDRKSPAIPDYNVLPTTGPILVRTYLDDPKCVLDSSALPTSANKAFVLVDDEHLLGRARDHENGVAYVSAYRVRFRENEAVVSLSTALRLPLGDKRGLACCCGGEMVLRRIDGRWVFVEWQNVMCA